MIDMSPAPGASMAATERSTMTIRELDRFKVIKEVADGGLKPWQAAERLRSSTRQIRDCSAGCERTGRNASCRNGAQRLGHRAERRNRRTKRVQPAPVRTRIPEASPSSDVSRAPATWCSSLSVCTNAGHRTAAVPELAQRQPCCRHGCSRPASPGVSEPKGQPVV